MESITPPRAAVPLAGSARPILEGRAEIAGQVLALPAGTPVDAIIVGRPMRDVVLLDVAGQLFQATLPEGALQDGAGKLPLVVLRGGERPAFLLDRGLPEPAATPSARVDLSALGSRLGAAVAAATKGQEIAPSAVSASPLLPAPPADADGLVPPLRQAVEGSGLFYESHQAEWVAGRRPLQALRTEPQAVAGRMLAQIEADPDGSVAPRSDGAAPATRQVPVAESGSNQEAISLPAPAIAQLVDRQLQALAGQPIVWSGQVWPGQTMDWQIEEDGPGESPDAPTQGWTSKLRLTLPNLGEVELRVGLREDRLSVRVIPGTEHVPAFRESAEELRHALAARGLSLIALEIAPDGDDA